MYELKSSDQGVEFFFLVRPEKIGWFKFILEGYDNLAILTTLSVQDGLVRIWTTGTALPELFALLEDIAPKLNRFNSALPSPSS